MRRQCACDAHVSRVEQLWRRVSDPRVFLIIESKQSEVPIGHREDTCVLHTMVWYRPDGDSGRPAATGERWAYEDDLTEPSVWWRLDDA